MELQAEAAAPDPALDFIVIGTQKGGTTSLWQYLRSHPEIAMPEYKEAPIFGFPGNHLEMLTWIRDDLLRDAPASALRGKVATNYMMGMEDADVERIAGRIANMLPRVRLIALLRDPIARAASHYRMSSRRGWESRPFDAAVEELLQTDQLSLARAQSSETNSYIVQGEYGRVLQIYQAALSSEQIHVEMTADLSREPGPVVDRILAFLGLMPGHRPDDLGKRYFRGGFRPRVDASGERELFAFLEENVWPKLGENDAERLRHSFNCFYQTSWNVVPDDEQPALSPSNRERLEAHYAIDAETLAAMGIAAPWLGQWSGDGDAAEM